MIKTFEEFICENKSNIIKHANIYGDFGEHEPESICKTWDEVLELFSNPKYNIECLVEPFDSFYSNGYSDWKKYDNLLSGIKRYGEILDKIQKTYKYQYEKKYIRIYIENGIIYVEMFFSNRFHYIEKIYLLNEQAQQARNKKKRVLSDYSKHEYRTYIENDFIRGIQSSKYENIEDNGGEISDTQIKSPKLKVIKDLEIYTDIPGQDPGMCETWSEVLKLFANSKYNDECIRKKVSERNNKSNWDKCHETPLQILRSITDNKSTRQLPEFKKVYIEDGAIHIVAIYSLHPRRIENYILYIMSDRAKKTIYTKDLSNPIYHEKVRMDFLDGYNIDISKYSIYKHTDKDDDLDDEYLEEDE